MTLAEAVELAETRRASSLGVRPLSYDYAGAAAELNCYESWLRDNIGRLPHSKLGQSVAFTTEHLATILRMFEVVPHVSPIPLTAAAGLDIAPRRARSQTPIPDLKPRGGRRRASA
ncbi:hypothetical protein [Embleya hyalina]|uniref:Uncharacterized protein n=1 Tax=Embleya hyalina TaxID=516124 RepID=A0A401YHH7_9ACTN|nr:hypothetical protein [Embleya hyalina]GCD94043.1 hypothetical protein EHYA_01699 [Embleya hyalina]